MGRARILVVDDEAYITEILTRWLENAGYSCTRSHSAEEALSLVGQNYVGLVISDVMMPGMSGIELLERLREQHHDLAVIMATAVDDRSTAIRTVRLGAYGYLIKPLDEEDVVINVANALERRRLKLLDRQYQSQLEREVRDRTDEIRRAREEISMMLVAISEHAGIGARILERRDLPLLHLAGEIALSHHERRDGSGYPHGRAGESIPRAARLVAIIDVYDALVNERVYRPALPEEEALRIMKDGRGSHFDPEIFDVFLELLPELRAIRERVAAQAA